MKYTARRFLRFNLKEAGEVNSISANKQKNKKEG